GSLAIVGDDRCEAFRFCSTGRIVQVFPLALCIRSRNPGAGIEARLRQLGPFAISGPDFGDFFLVSLFLFGFRGLGLLPLFLQFLVLSTDFRRGRSGPCRLRGSGRNRLGRRGGLDAWLLDDVLGRNVGRRRLVAEHLAAVLVDPLPLGERQRGQGTGQAKHGNAKQFHWASVAPACEKQPPSSAQNAQFVGKKPRDCCEGNYRGRRVQSFFW